MRERKKEGENDGKKGNGELWNRSQKYARDHRATSEQPTDRLTDQTRSDDQSQGRPAPSVCAIGSLSRALLMANRATSMEVAVLVLLLLLAAAAAVGGGGGGGGGSSGGGGWSGT